MTDTPSARALARLHHAQALQTLAELARAGVPTYADAHADPGEYLTAARRLRLAAERVLDAAAAVEVAGGTATEDVADWLALPAGTVERRVRIASEKAAQMDPTAVGERLDRWYAATSEMAGAPADAVTRGLY